MENDNQDNKPVVLGVLRKEKSSRPIFVIIFLGLIIGVTFSLPYIEKYINDPNFSFKDLFNKENNNNNNNDKNDKPVEESKYILNSDTKIMYNNLILSNITLSDSTISYDVNNIDLNKDNYYLEIYLDNNLLETIRLSSISSYTTSKLKFNPEDDYYGKIINLTESDYKDINIIDDKLTCIYNNTEYIYMFNSNLLTSINHTYTFTDISNITVYLNEFQKYNNFTNNINKIKVESSNTEEIDNGFIFNANLDLNIINKNNLKEADNNHYYNLGKEAKIINHDLLLTGFICK